MELKSESLDELRARKGYCNEISELHHKLGWEEEHAEAWVMLGLRRDVIALALKEVCALRARA